MATLKVDDIRKATTPGRLADGGGLFLNIAKGGSKSWILRIRIDGRRLDKGLGSFPAVTLTQARKLADANRVAVAQGGKSVGSQGTPGQSHGQGGRCATAQNLDV